jgi:gas vesicle protein
MNSLKFWAVFSIGVAAGAAVALIYAPQTGVKTRKQLKRGFEDASDYVKDATTYVKDATSKVGDQAQDVFNRGKSVVSDAVESATNAASAATDAAKKKIAEFA